MKICYKCGTCFSDNVYQTFALFDGATVYLVARFSGLCLRKWHQSNTNVLHIVRRNVCRRVFISQAFSIGSERGDFFCPADEVYLCGDLLKRWNVLWEWARQLFSHKICWEHIVADTRLFVDLYCSRWSTRSELYRTQYYNHEKFAEQTTWMRPRHSNIFSVVTTINCE